MPAAPSRLDHALPVYALASDTLIGVIRAWPIARDSMSGLEAAAKLTSAVRRLILDYAHQAHEDGHSWQEIGVALGIKAVDDSGVSVADAAYDYAAGAPGFGRASFAWVCSACRGTVIDRGTQAGHPADAEEGHADHCRRGGPGLARAKGLGALANSSGFLKTRFRNSATVRYLLAADRRETVRRLA